MHTFAYKEHDMNRNTRINRIVGIVGLAAVGVLATHAHAQVWHYDWTPFTNCGGTTTRTTTSPYAQNQIATGGNSNIAGDTDSRFTACVDMTITLNFTYTSTDVGAYDKAYIRINGVETTLATNATQGTFVRTFDLLKGDTVRIGVKTTDGKYGAGVLDYKVTAAMTLPYEAFTWTTEILGGTAIVKGTPPVLQVQNVGSSSGDAWLKTKYLKKITIGYNGIFSHTPLSSWANAYFYTTDANAPFYHQIGYLTGTPSMPVAGTFIQSHIGPPLAPPGSWLGEVWLRVKKNGPGTATLALDRVTATLPVADVPYLKLTPNSGGTNGTVTTSLTLSEIQIVGGNNAITGDTKTTMVAPTALRVQAELQYSSPDIGCNDRAFYIINGVTTTIACNSAPGTHLVQFDVLKGQTFGFGVNTINGTGGAGTANFQRVRLFADADATDGFSGPACMADCDTDGSLSIDDFICFQSQYSLGDSAADCDADGTLAIEDFICFQTLFSLGC
jgi:hypothetical protein